MKTLVNNHVHSTELAVIGADCYDATEPTLLTSFGWLPKFELPVGSSLIVEYSPRGGLRGLLFSGRWFRPARQVEAFASGDTETVARWLKPYRWRHTLGFKVSGTLVHECRIDHLLLKHYCEVGGQPTNQLYAVALSVTIDALRLYLFLRRAANSGMALAQTVRELMADQVDREIMARGGSFAFITHCQPRHELLDEAGLNIQEARIEYVNQ